MNNHIYKVVYVMFVETVSGLNLTSENMNKKSTNFFLVPGLRSQHFGHLLQKSKLQLIASLSSNHSLDLYFPKSLGPYKTSFDCFGGKGYLQNESSVLQSNSSLNNFRFERRPRQT